MVEDKTPQECFEDLQARETAVLIDVRTAPEWSFVGTPTHPRCLRISSTLFPPNQPNPNFLAEVEQQVAKDQPVYCLCKLGGRSMAAAQALVAAGYTEVYNVLNGFDGDQNEHGQRRCINGWVASGLPWHQA